jgi:hypothetical protein
MTPLCPPGGLVPLVKVGRDLAAEPAFLRTLNRATPGARCVSARRPTAASSCTAERGAPLRTDVGGVPGWTWPELGPRWQTSTPSTSISFPDSRWASARAQAAAGVSSSIYADLHSLFLGMRQDGIRMLQPSPMLELVRVLRCRPDE